jgi:hypothetical protein
LWDEGFLKPQVNHEIAYFERRQGKMDNVDNKFQSEHYEIDLLKFAQKAIELYGAKFIKNSYRYKNIVTSSEEFLIDFIKRIARDDSRLIVKNSRTSLRKHTKKFQMVGNEDFCKMIFTYFPNFSFRFRVNNGEIIKKKIRKDYKFPEYDVLNQYYSSKKDKLIRLSCGFLQYERWREFYDLKEFTKIEEDFCILLVFCGGRRALRRKIYKWIEMHNLDYDPDDPDHLNLFLETFTANYPVDVTAEELSGVEKIAVASSGIQRIGQQTFRQSVLGVFGEACCLTKCKEVAVLQAAHIVPYRGESSNRVENGLCLRSDIHTLFDRGLLAINPVTLTVELNKSVVDGEYKRLDKRSIWLPKGFNVDALRSCLKWHYENVFR